MTTAPRWLAEPYTRVEVHILGATVVVTARSHGWRRRRPIRRALDGVAREANVASS
jgi:hypothetical protein